MEFGPQAGIQHFIILFFLQGKELILISQGEYNLPELRKQHQAGSSGAKH
jgi:hypothetical protein